MFNPILNLALHSRVKHKINKLILCIISHENELVVLNAD